MKIKLVEKTKHGTGIHSYSFSKPEGFSYNAGQFIELTLIHKQPDSRGQKRWFTLSSSPTEDVLTITTKHAKNDQSSFKRTLSQMKVGDSVVMSEPMGDFVLPKNTKKPLLFVAGGIGITPFRSMCKLLSDLGRERSVSLIYAAKQQDSFVFFDELERVATVQKVSGNLRSEDILEHSKKHDNPLIYISGPEQLVETLYDDLKNQFTQSQLLRDYFPNYTYMQKEGST